MENNQQSRKAIPPLYYVQSLLKLTFIVMATINLPYSVLVGILASLCGVIRILKSPQFNKQYLQKVLLNAHGQNLIYLGMGLIGYTNFLYFAPLILYFFYGLAQFYNQLFPEGSGTGSPKIQELVKKIRNSRWFFMQTKSRLQIIYVIYLLVTIPIDYSRILKALLIGQFNLLKFRVTAETKHAATNINSYIVNKISGIGFVHKYYNKIIDYIYKFATQEPGPQ